MPAGAGEDVEDGLAADECKGLQTCLPITGPWVAIPAPARGEASTAVWEMRCPLKGYIVAGVDARVSDRAIDISIRGENGAPVSPGVTTGREVVFTAVYAGGASRPTSFQPFIGCIPTSGGGGRGETALRRPATARCRAASTTRTAVSQSARSTARRVRVPWT